MLRTHAYRRLPRALTESIDRLNRVNTPYAAMPEATRSRLIEVFAEDNRALGAWLGRDLSAWNRR